MISSIEKSLTVLDEFFKNKKSSDIVLIFILPIIISAGLSYKLLFPICDKALFANKQMAMDLKDKIIGAKAFLGQSEDPKQFAIFLNNKLSNLQKELVEVKSKNEKTEIELSGIEFAYLDQDNVNSFLDAVAVFSSKSSVKIQKISSAFVDMNETVLKRKAVVEMSVNGDFKSIMYLIGDIENSNFLVRIDEAKLSRSKSVEAELTISIFGINR
jgi:hypothetical protein